MEIDIKRKNKKVEYYSIEASSQYDVNRLDNVQKIGTVYLMNKNNHSLMELSEMELKKYFTKSKEELIQVLQEAIELNKADYDQRNEEIIINAINNEIENSNFIKFIDIVDEFPENPNTGEIYGLRVNDSIAYYIYLNDRFFALIGKDQFEQTYYNKEVLNSKFEELNSKLNGMIDVIDNITENAITKEDLSGYIEKLNELKELIPSSLQN